MAQGTVRVDGESYNLTWLQPADVRSGTLVRFAAGSVVRRILCTDGDEVVLRGVRSPDVFEAVPADSLLTEWLQLVPAES